MYVLTHKKNWGDLREYTFLLVRNLRLHILCSEIVTDRDSHTHTSTHTFHIRISERKNKYVVSYTNTLGHSGGSQIFLSTESLRPEMSENTLLVGMT